MRTGRRSDKSVMVMMRQINSKGKLVSVEQVDEKTIEHNSLPDNSAPTIDEIKRMDAFVVKGAEPDDECPELTDEQIARIMRKAKA